MPFLFSLFSLELDPCEWGHIEIAVGSLGINSFRGDLLYFSHDFSGFVTADWDIFYIRGLIAYFKDND